MGESINQLELTFRARHGGHSQCDRILAYLETRRGQLVPMPELARAATPTGIGTAVHSRINDLRRRGHPIPPAKIEVAPDGSHHSSYILP